MSRMVANAYGKMKARRFQKRFGLTNVFPGSDDPDYVDAHDYLHTVTGMLPVWEDELKVLELEQLVLEGKIQLRGLVSA